MILSLTLLLVVEVPIEEPLVSVIILRVWKDGPKRLGIADRRLRLRRLFHLHFQVSCSQGADGTVTSVQREPELIFMWDVSDGLSTGQGTGD